MEYTLIVLSSLTDSSFSPVVLNLTAQTWSLCSLNVWTHCLVLTSHTCNYHYYENYHVIMRIVISTCPHLNCAVTAARDKMFIIWTKVN